MNRAGAAWALVTLAAWGDGCGRTSVVAGDGGGAGNDGGSGAVTEVVEASAPVPRPVAPRPPPAPCRAIAVSGKARAFQGGDGGEGTEGVLALADPVPSWLELQTAARVTVKEPRTGRELLFVGPAMALPCQTESEAWLVRGEITSARGSGEKPGAEQWIVTPFAVVRYGAAVLDVKVDGGGVRAVLQAGGASAIADDGFAWHPLDPSVPFVVKAAAAGGDGGLADRCARTSADARTLEEQLLAPGETRDPGFGDLAKRTTEARILARAICAIRDLRGAMRSAPASIPAPAPSHVTP